MLLSAIEGEAGLAVISVVIGWLLHTCSNYWSQRKVFDQRLRLEKEYQLYVELWESLFELRRALGAAISAFTHPEDMPSDEFVRERFNKFQSIARKGEPFYSPAVYEPVRSITLLGRQIIQNWQESNHLRTLRDDNRQRIAELEEKNNESFELLSTFTDAVSTAIRKRVGPP